MDSTFESFINDARAASRSEYAKHLIENIERNANLENPWINVFDSIKKGEIIKFLFPEWTSAAIVLVASFLLMEIFKNSLKSSAIYHSLTYILRFFGGAAFIISINEFVVRILEYMHEIVAFLGVLAPTVGTVAAAGGNIASAKTLNVFITLLISVFQVILAKLLPGICSAFFGIAVLDMVNSEGRMLMLSQTIRNLLYSAFSIFTALFCIILGTQSLAATGTDSFSAKAIRLAVGNAVPIVGGTLGEALKLVGGSIVAVKNAIGTASVVFILFMYLPPLLMLWGNNILINFFMFLCDYFSLKEVKSLFIHMKYVIGFIFAASASLFVMGMINIGIFMGIVPVISA